MDERVEGVVTSAEASGDGHLRAHLEEMKGLLGARARWAYLGWVVAWIGALVFMAVTYWSSGRVGF